MKKLKTFNELNELNVSTYADLMNKTYDYPWVKYFSKNPDKDINPKELGNQQGRINTLAKNRFVEEFYKEFSQETISINTSKGKYIFDSIKFKTNYTYYDLIFKGKGDYDLDDYLWIMPDNNNYYIDKKDLKIIDDKSDKIIREMLKYNKNFS